MVEIYMVSKVMKNDESFIFIIQFGANRLQKMFMHPVVIRKMQVELAPSDRGLIIANKMISLCEQLGTKTVWNEDGQYLEVIFG
jgi:hypothetical protein